MPAEDARLEDARGWLEKAALDLRAAELLVGSSDAGLLGNAAFHAQQAAEKALKAFLAWHDEPFRKTHSIEKLRKACVAIAPDLATVIDAAVPLTEYACSASATHPGPPRRRIIKVRAGESQHEGDLPG
jgi:HEPN domain-containing protein